MTQINMSRKGNVCIITPKQNFWDIHDDHWLGLTHQMKGLVGVRLYAIVKLHGHVYTSHQRCDNLGAEHWDWNRKWVEVERIEGEEGEEE